MSKPRVITNYDKLDGPIKEQLKLFYPRGFQKHLILFRNAKGKIVSALPFETEDRNYLIRMSSEKAIAIILNDEDYDEYGKLKESVKDEYSDNQEEDQLDIDELPESEMMVMSETELD